MERHKLVHWYALKDFEELRRPFPPCLYYLRPLACHDRNNPVESDNGDGMRSECVFIERQLGRMSPVHVETIVAEPDCMQNYRPGPVEVGIWKVNTDPNLNPLKTFNHRLSSLLAIRKPLQTKSKGFNPLCGFDG